MVKMKSRQLSIKAKIYPKTKISLWDLCFKKQNRSYCFNICSDDQHENKTKIQSIISPEVRAAKKGKKKLREFLQLLDVEDYSDLRSVFKEMVGEVPENGLEAELDDELGYSKYDYRNIDTDNSRNGYSRKSVKTSAGSVEIAVPRDRNGEFEPQIIRKNETSLAGDIEEKIMSMYAKGMTTNDISYHIQDIYGIDVSDSLVSRVTDKKYCLL